MHIVYRFLRILICVLWDGNVRILITAIIQTLLRIVVILITALNVNFVMSVRFVIVVIIVTTLRNVWGLGTLNTPMI